MLTPYPFEKYYKRNDPTDLRIGDLILPANEDTQNQFVLIGYPDDEGIQLNGGRLGAQLGPEQIRYQLSRMTPGFYKESLNIADIGDIKPLQSLKERHEFAKNAVSQLRNNNNRVISLGGGHDYGYVDGSAFLETHTSNARPLIINFDAHLDVRPDDKNLNSGTPFYRLLKQYKNFDFAEVGIQQLCNSKAHFDFCKSKDTKLVIWDEFVQSGLSFTEYACRQLEPWLDRKRPTFISLDIDVFSSSYAMGCSQAWPSGLTPEMFMPLFNLLLNRLNVTQLGIYEVSPPLDQDHRTSKLAAQIIYDYIQAYDV